MQQCVLYLLVGALVEVVGKCESDGKGRWSRTAPLFDEKDSAAVVQTCSQDPTMDGVPLEAVIEHPTESESSGQNPKTCWGNCLSLLAWECLRNFQEGQGEEFVGDEFSQHPVDIRYVSASQEMSTFDRRVCLKNTFIYLNTFVNCIWIFHCMWNIFSQCVLSVFFLWEWHSCVLGWVTGTEGDWTARARR